jgi:thiol-disulfide isomerase/thioredoxin
MVMMFGDCVWSVSKVFAQTTPLTHVEAQEYLLDYTIQFVAATDSLTEIDPALARTPETKALHLQTPTRTVSVFVNAMGTIYADLNSDGRITATEQIPLQGDTLGTYGRIEIPDTFPFRQTVDVYPTLPPGLRNIGLPPGVMLGNPELYLGQWYTGQDTILIGVYLAAMKWKYEKSKSLSIYMDVNEDSVFSQTERYDADLPMQVGKHHVEVADIFRSEDRVIIEFQSTEQAVAPVEHFTYPSTSVVALMHKDTTDFPPKNTRLTVVNYWSISCPPCRSEIPHLNVLVQSYPDVTFVAVNPLEPPNRIRAFLAKHPFAYTHYCMEAPIADSVFRVQAYPTHVVLDSTNTVLYQSHGYFPSLEDTLRKVIERALPEFAR